MIEELLAKAISSYTVSNDRLRQQMKGKVTVPTWEGLPFFHKLIVLDNIVTGDTPCFKEFPPTKIEYYIGEGKADV